ncbi:helix-turn-helix transcriptional regulator [Actinacidiphila epipremni]|uniref:Helix-turn-helix domain-containing protein n=1 Tax=Actinacidiphila epipremni TaxID=2053013 RepID=A0ABX0ZV16_9ACTN|nr:helix-turn-helix transcriptional regulator [Actinacidiphila epipremni]NJP46119.1 helix-turn-helix domain-containing protein [Actinacidiphila epipremni]
MDKHALAAFLRGRREQIRPEDAGLPRGPRRRTPGLRREEVAALAHISTDHYTRLEQARGRHPSRQVLQSLARALRLSDQERAHLFALADAAPPGRDRHPARDVAPTTAALLDRLTDTPAMVVDATCRVIAWNPLAAALFPDFTALRSADRNLLRRIFLHPGTIPTSDPERFRTTAVTYLRLAATRYPDDAELHALVAELRAASPDFATLWSTQRLQLTHHARQTFHHPTLGALDLDFDTLTIPDRDHHLLLFTTTPDSPSAHLLPLLKSLTFDPA